MAPLRADSSCIFDLPCLRLPLAAGTVRHDRGLAASPHAWYTLEAEKDGSGDIVGVHLANFKVPDQRQLLEHLARLNIEPYATDEVVVTVVDPDGRKVMFGTA